MDPGIALKAPQYTARRKCKNCFQSRSWISRNKVVATYWTRTTKAAIETRHPAIQSFCLCTETGWHGAENTKGKRAKVHAAWMLTLCLGALLPNPKQALLERVWVYMRDTDCPVVQVCLVSSNKPILTRLNPFVHPHTDNPPRFTCRAKAHLPTAPTPPTYTKSSQWQYTYY